MNALLEVTPGDSCLLCLDIVRSRFLCCVSDLSSFLHLYALDYVSHETNTPSLRQSPETVAWNALSLTVDSRFRT